MTRPRTPLFCVLAVLALALGATSAKAELLVLNHSGTFSANSTLNGVPFGAPTPFTYQAVFDPATDMDPSIGVGIFHTVVTFNILGFGTVTSDPAGDVTVLLADPDGLGLPLYAVGLSDATGTPGYVSAFFVAAPPFDADMPTPSALSGLFVSVSDFAFTVPLSGGAGNLVINNITNFGTTAQITAVPEPSTLALLGAGVVCLAGAAWRRHRKQSSSSTNRASQGTVRGQQ